MTATQQAIGTATRRHLALGVAGLLAISALPVLAQAPAPGGIPGVLAPGAAPHRNSWAASVCGESFVKIDYLVAVNGPVAQAVLEASSRFSARSGGCSR